MWWLNGSSRDCQTSAPGSNMASPQHMHEHVNSKLDNHRLDMGTAGWPLRGGRVENIKDTKKLMNKKHKFLQDNELVGLAGGGNLSDLSELFILDLHNNSLEKLPEEIGLLVKLTVSPKQLPVQAPVSPKQLHGQILIGYWTSY